MCRCFIVILFFLTSIKVCSQVQDPLLPPVIPWKGKSLSLIAKKNNHWITPTELSDFQTTPSYEQTMSWLRNLCSASSWLEMITIGKSNNDRNIEMVIATKDEIFTKESLRKSDKPLLLIQAGIHSGEVDGKDAGMMLLRDIAFGKKNGLLDRVNILFIPILNVDGHERTSQYNRVNQRGPSNMGWRTNGRNLNLNRDYAKLDAPETRAVVKVMTEYSPSLYLDLHVTDGADYQYDITFGYTDYSPSVFQWLEKKLTPIAYQILKSYGHIPGPLMFSANDRDFTQGNSEFPYSPRFSNSYGDIRAVPSILVENHSLKPFKQRVLGTYVFLEGVIEALSNDGKGIKEAIARDQQRRSAELTLTWGQSQPDTMTLLGVESKIQKSEITSGDYVSWTGKLVTQKIPQLKYKKPEQQVRRPKAYWVPSTYPEVIERLAHHGIEMEKINDVREVDVDLYRVADPKFSTGPFEGHFTVSANVKAEEHKEIFYPGSVRVPTDQALGDLVVFLLEPASPDSFFQWGFFLEIFNQTEYIEEYAIEPLARIMLLKDEKLRAEFEVKKQQDPAFANNKAAVYNWFYSRSPYVDSRYLLYPVGIER